MTMDFLDSLNHYLATHPVMLDQLEFAFRIKYWLLLGIAIYFVLLPYREYKKEIKKQIELSKTEGHFLA
jgi:hypothetical protein